MSNIAFLVELIIKLLAVEWKMFVSQRLNLMDVILCIVFLGFFIADQTEAGQFSLDHEDLKLTNKYAFLSTLRALRLIMVARVSKSIKILLECCVYTFDSTGVSG